MTTISELEKERAKILAEIESKSNAFSSQANDDKPSQSLKDWLSAAEEVMPDKTQQSTQTHYSNKVIPPKPNNRNTFFGIVITLTLFLTVLGVVYIAYSSLQKDLQNIIALKNDNAEQFKILQLDMKTLQESVASGGQSKLFIALQERVTALEERLATISENQATTETNNQDSQSIPTNNANLALTETVLETKLQNYSAQLEQKIDQKLEQFLQKLTKANAAKETDAKDSNQVKNNPDLSQAKPATAQNVSSQASQTPEVGEVTTPDAEQPVIKLVEKVKQPTEPKTPKAPVINATSDVKWLLQQTPKQYVLQLASMPKENALKQTKVAQQMNKGKVIPQQRNDSTYFVLLAEQAFASRTAATAYAKEIKANTGTSPWVRQAEDLQRRVQ